MATESATNDERLHEEDDSDMDDPEMSKLRDIIRNLEKTQNLLTSATDTSLSSPTAVDSTATDQSQAAATKHLVNGTSNSPQRSAAANDSATAPINGVAKQISTTRNSKQPSRKGSRGGSPSRDQTVPRSGSRASQSQLSDDDDFDFEANEAAANADDESWLLSGAKASAQAPTGDPQPVLTNGNHDASLPSNDSRSEVLPSSPLTNDHVGDKSSANNQSESNTLPTEDDQPMPPASAAVGASMTELRRLAEAQEAEMRREAQQSRRVLGSESQLEPTANLSAAQSTSVYEFSQPTGLTPTPTPAQKLNAASTNNLDLKASGSRGFPDGSGTNLSGLQGDIGSASNLQPSGSYQQLAYTPRGSVSSSTAVRQQQQPASLIAGGSAQVRGRSNVSSGQYPRSQSVTRGSASDLSAELRTVIDPARIFDADQKLELQKAQSSSVLNKSGISLASGRRGVTPTANRTSTATSTSLLGRATTGRPASTIGTRAGSQPPITRTSVSRVSASIMPSDQIDLANYNEVAASEPSIPGATTRSGMQPTLANAQRRGITASASRVSQTGRPGAQPVGLVRAVGTTGRPAVNPVVGGPMQRSSSQPIRSGAQTTVRRPSNQLGAAPLSARSTSGTLSARSTSGTLSARTSSTVTRSSSATPLSQAGRTGVVPRTVSATFARGGTTSRVTPLSARPGTTPLTRGRPGTAPAPAPLSRSSITPRTAGPRTTVPLTRGGTVRPVSTRGVTPLTKPGTSSVRQPLPPGYGVARAGTLQRGVAPAVQRTPIPIGAVQRGRGAVAVGTVTRTGVVPLTARAPLLRASVPAGTVLVRANGGTLLRGAAPMPGYGGIMRPSAPLTQRAIEQHTIATANIEQRPVDGLLMVSSVEMQPANPAPAKAEDDSWKDDCF